MDIKRFAVAGATIILTTGLAVLAIAIAQRDSRESESMLHDDAPAYANQTPEPLTFALGPEALQSEAPPPVPNNLLRTISFPKSQPVEEDPAEFETPLEEPPPFPIPRTAIALPNRRDDSEVVQAAGEQPLNPNNGAGSVASPRLLTAPAPLPGVASSPAMSNPPPAMNVGPPKPLGSNGLQTPSATLMPPTLGPSTPPSTPAMSGPPPSPMSNAPILPTTNASMPAPPPNVPNFGPAANPVNLAPTFGAPTSLAPPPAFNSNPPPSAQPNFPSPAFPSSNAPPPGYPTTANPRNSNAAPTVPDASSSRSEPLGNAGTPAPRDLPRSFGQAPSSYASSGSGAPAKLASLASAAPGSRQIDGAQNPSMQIQKKAPEEVQVGQVATFALTVRNVGNATAYDVSVVDSVPRGTKLSKTNPPAENRADGTLVWSLGEMAAGTEQVLTVELIPETEGEIGSVASVNFAAQASVRTVSTQPKLVIKQVAEKKILLGKSLGIRVTVANEGTGVARGVALEEDVPRGLRHPMGSSLGVPLGDLAPGQSKSTDLELIAVEPGFTQNVMRAVAANTSDSNSSVDIEVVAPKLKVDVVGPKLRYLERQATYQVTVVNQGSSTAYDVEITAQLPRGMQYNSSGNHGEYHSSKHSVTWALEELPVGATATTEMTLLPVEEGAFAIRMQSRAVGIESEPVEKQVQIEGQSELAFSIDDDNDPIEVDGQTTYLVRLTNTGTRLDEDVQVMIELPAGSRILQVNAPVAYKETQQGLLFEPISQMRAKDQHQFRFAVQLAREGVQIARAHVKSKLRPTPVVKEESTEVYRDR